MVFKIEKRRSRKNGVLHLTRCYFLRYRFGEMLVDRWKSLGVSDKQVAEKLAQEFRKEWEQEAAGILEPKIIRSAAARPLAEHLKDYVADLEKRNRAGRNGSGGRKNAMRITALLNGCSWKVAFNINADSFIAWRSRQKQSARTLNHYLQAMIAFLNWMERAGRIKGNPLKSVEKIDERGQEKRVRRAFTDDELRRLVTGSGPRGIVYFMAARSGLRQNELRQLIWEDVRLDAETPTVRVRSSCAKNKKEELVPLIPELVEKLKAHRPVKYSPSSLVFASVPQARTLRTDSEKLGIAYRDESGRYADFHALRYTWATFLQRHDIPQRFAMKLLRHSDIKLTSKVYTDETQLPIYDAVKVLPRLMDRTQIRAQISGATGDFVSQSVANGEGKRTSEDADNQQNSRKLTVPVAPCQKSVRGGFEPPVPFWSTAL